jgi:hypothetical protein
MFEQEETYNAANEDHVAQAEKEARDKRERELMDVREILESKAGRRFFSRYLRICGIYKTSFTGNNTTFMREGERSIGLRLLAEMNEAAPDLYIEMLKDELELKMRKQKSTN